MGHKRLGELPRTRKWQKVVALLTEGADVGAIAAASAEAAERGFRGAASDPALVHAFWLLTQIPRAARTADFAAELRRLGLPVGEAPTLIDLVGAFTDAVDRHVRKCGGRTDLGEMAQLAAAEALSAAAGRDLPGLFGPSPDDVKLAIARLATTRQFGVLARDFFAGLTRRHLAYYLDRELSNHVGADGRFKTIAEHAQFNDALALHCRQASRIVEDFSGGWLSKKIYENRLKPGEVTKFAGVAFKKIEKELRKRRDADG